MEMVDISRFDIFLVTLDPTAGAEIKKTRPCVIISPDEINHNLRTVVVAPMTTKGQNYPTRVSIKFRQKEGLVVLDQIRTVDKSRLVKKLGSLKEPEAKRVLSILQEMFAD